MPTILLKKSDTASAVPTTANLTNLAGGVEVAVNTADRRMFTMNSSSAVVELGTNPTTLSTASLTVTTGNAAFTGTGQRITGDFSNATLSNRLAFQTSTTNGNTIVGAFPNGTGTNTRLQLFSASDPANASTASMEANATSSLVIINADKTGTGAYLPMTFYTNGAEKSRLTVSGNLLVGTTTDVSGLSGVISDVAGNVRAIPRAGAAKTSTYTLAITDIGDYIELGTGGGIDVPNGVFSTGDVVSVFNNTTGNRTISLTITTAYIAGTDSDKASVTLATRGVATILFISNSVCVVTGNVT